MLTHVVYVVNFICIVVLTAMVDVSQFVLSFDPSLILLSWKALGKFICHMKDRAQLLDSSQLKLVSVINGMCEAMLAKSTECVNSAHHCDKVYIHMCMSSSHLSSYI